jgi:DnaK suppressor protein
MNVEHYKELLNARERDLTADIQRQDENLAEAQAEVGDPEDLAVSDQNKTTAIELSTNAADNLAMVHEALTRIDEGVYGKCVECGRDIGEARLNAVPWTPYCIEDQERLDKENGSVMHATM